MKLYKLLTISVLMLFIGATLHAQDRTYKGTVADVLGNPMVGVNITAKDYPNITTLSSYDGTFRI